MPELPVTPSGGRTYVDLDCWQMDDGRVFVGNRATEYVPKAEAERLRDLLKLEGEMKAKAYAENERLRGLIANYFNARTTFDLSDPDEQHDAADLLTDAERALRDA